MRLVLAMAIAALSLAPGEHVGFNGVSGSGKTRLAQELAATQPRVSTFDPMARVSWDARDRGELVSPWGSELVTFSELVRSPELLDRPRFDLAVDPETDDPARMAQRFTVFVQLCWATGRMLVVCEEEALYGRLSIPILLKLTTGGRHMGLASMHVAQNIGRIPIDVRRNLTAIASGPQSEPGDIDAIRHRCGERTARAVARLRKGDPFVYWRLGEGVEEST